MILLIFVQTKFSLLLKKIETISKLFLSTSYQVKLPAEFKHINKRRKKKLTRIPLVRATEQGRAQIENLSWVTLRANCSLWNQCVPSSFLVSDQSSLEWDTREGDSPVWRSGAKGGMCDIDSSSRVVWEYSTKIVYGW